MARARNIKPGFFKNEDLAECTPWARLCFAGLWTLADREGRLEDRPKRIKGELFPFDSVEAEPLLAELVQWGFIVRYQVGGSRFIQITKFVEHQAPHGTEKDGLIPDANGCLTVHERGRNGYVTGIPRLEPYVLTVLPPMSDGIDNSSLTVKGGVSDGGHNTLIPDSLIPDSLIPEITPLPPKGGGRGGRLRDGADPEGFAAWYELYQRKDARADAVKAWRQLSPNDELQGRMLDALRRWPWSPDRTKIPLPATWLRGERWKDQAIVQTGASGGASAPKPGTDAYFVQHRDAQWWKDAGFANVFEAHNGMCWDWNAHLFLEGCKVPRSEEAHA